MVGSIVPFDAVITRVAIQFIIVSAAPDRVVPRVAGDRVIAGSAFKHITERVAKQPIAIGRSQHSRNRSHIVECEPQLGIDRLSGDQSHIHRDRYRHSREVERVGSCLVTYDERVRPELCRSRKDECVVVVAAVESVVAGTPFERVVTGLAIELIVAIQP